MYSRCHALSFVAVLRCYAKDLTVEFAGCTSPNQISWPQQPAGGRRRGGGMRRRGRADEWLRRRQRRRGHRQPRLRRRTRLLLGQQEPIRPQGLRKASGCMMCITDGLLVALCASLACSLKQRLPPRAGRGHGVFKLFRLMLLCPWHPGAARLCLTNRSSNIAPTPGSPSTLWLAARGWPTGCMAKSRPPCTGPSLRQKSRSTMAPWPGPPRPAPRTWPRGSCGAG